MSELVLWPDPRLSKVCDEVPKGADVAEIVAEMRAIMEEKRGIGIAAPQVGEMLRVIVCMDHVLINPTIKHASKQMRWVEEGCLSFPETCPRFGQRGVVVRAGKTVRVRRHKLISMRAFDLDWNPITVKGRDWKGACMQHELEHLDGITLADYRKSVNLPRRRFNV